jgi:hypothetical protein
MPRQGKFSHADVAKKLAGATVRFSKGSLQEAMNMLYDAIAMLNVMHPAFIAQAVMSGKQEVLGKPNGEFRQASITEHVALATMKLEANPAQAMIEVRTAIELLDRYAMGKNQTLEKKPSEKWTPERNDYVDETAGS